MKGLLFHYLRDWVVLRRGHAEWALVIARLEPADADVLRDEVLRSGWYPIGAWNRVIESIMLSFPDADAAMEDFSSYLGDRELHSLVRMLLRFGSPAFLIKRTSFLWSRYFNTGTFGTSEVASRRWHLWLEAPTDVEEGVNRLTCAHGPAPWLERGIVLAGATRGRVRHVRCRHDGFPRCEYDVEW